MTAVHIFRYRRMARRLLFAACGLSACLTVATPVQADSESDTYNLIGTLVQQMAGEYRTVQSAGDATQSSAAEPRLVDRRVQVTAPAIGRHVVYWQLNSGPDEVVYRQRLLLFVPGADEQSIVQKTYSFRTPDRYVDAFATPQLFLDITPDDLVESLPEKGCDQVWRPDGDGEFRGRVNPYTCRFWSERREQWRRIGADARVTETAYWQAERGFDDTGQQLFGTPPGELYELRRMAAPELTARDILAAAHAAAGGDVWRHAKTLQLSGDATLYRDGKAMRADRYEMKRVYPRELTSAHTTTGKFRLDAYAGDRVLFRTSNDGQRSYDDNGPLPPRASDELGATAYGFSAVRFALAPGFELERLPDDQIEGLPSYFVRITDPGGGHTVVAIDQAAERIRYLGWQTPRGWHVRLYSDFYWLAEPGFVQPGRVRHYYDGAKTADIFWRTAAVNVPLADEQFVIAAQR